MAETTDDDVAHLLDECRTIEENCLYTAQAHFILADRRARHAQLMIFIPSVVGAVAGILVAVGLPAWIGAFAAAAGIVTAAAGFIGVDAKPYSHRIAANALTTLRHEARALRETHSKELTRPLLAEAVRRLDDKYNSLVVGLEPTDKEAFEEARARVKSGRFEQDFRAPQPALKPPP